MIKLEDAIIAKLNKNNEIFEILVDPEIAQKIRNKEPVNIMDGLAIDIVFKDSKKGLKASEEKLKNVFHTTNVEEIARTIIENGELQITTEQRRKMIDTKKKQIIAEITRNCINPQTSTPHPPIRIENAMNEANVKIDPFKPVSVQIQEVIKKISPIIPIRFEKIKIAVKLSGTDYGKIYGDIKAIGNIIKEDWQSNGFWVGIVELPAGQKDEFFEMINNRTKGNAELKLLK